MNIAILGAGSIALANAALLADGGHRVTLWSPSGKGTASLGHDFTLNFSGAATGRAIVHAEADVGAAISGAEVVVISVPAYGHKAVMDAVAPHLTPAQVVFVMPMLSLTSLYLSKLLCARGVAVPIVSFGTTVMTARRKGPADVQLLSIRSKLDLAALPERSTDEGMRIATALYGERFNAQTDTLAVSMVNVNPISHVPLALANLTRIEKGEVWTQYDNMAGGVARMIVAVDRERLNVAAAFGLDVRSIEEHFHYSFGVPMADLGTQSLAVHNGVGSPVGPVSLSSRYFTEDVPYGLAFYAAMGRMTGTRTPCTDACITLASTACGRDFANENAMIGALGLDRASPEELLALARNGYGRT
ncbi:MAG: NAD/NADP octopine/nopaline dehydrogenase family protein [Betaproteobacteria bacterium]